MALLKDLETLGSIVDEIQQVLEDRYKKSFAGTAFAGYPKYIEDLGVGDDGSGNVIDLSDLVAQASALVKQILREA